MCKYLNELVNDISPYITCCVNSVIPTKQIAVFRNNKFECKTELKIKQVNIKLNSADFMEHRSCDNFLSGAMTPI